MTIRRSNRINAVNHRRSPRLATNSTSTPGYSTSIRRKQSLRSKAKEVKKKAPKSKHHLSISKTQHRKSPRLVSRCTLLQRKGRKSFNKTGVMERVRANDRRIAKQTKREQEEQRLKEREAKKAASKLLRPLMEEEQDIVNDAIYGDGPDDELLAKTDTDSVMRKSMWTLQPSCLLNDEVINYFYLMLNKRDEELCNNEEGGRKRKRRRRSHFFNSFFFTKLFDDDGYANVERWSKHVHGEDIFELDKIFFPCNIRNDHWCCAVIFMQEKRIQFYNSMHGSGMRYMKRLMQYLKNEWKAKKGGDLPDADKWRLVRCQKSDVPRQKNGHDCGVFTCMFADFLSLGRPLSFNQKHISRCRERIALSIMKGGVIE